MFIMDKSKKDNKKDIKSKSKRKKNPPISNE